MLKSAGFGSAQLHVPSRSADELISLHLISLHLNGKWVRAGRLLREEQRAGGRRYATDADAHRSPAPSNPALEREPLGTMHTHEGP